MRPAHYRVWTCFCFSGRRQCRSGAVRTGSLGAVSALLPLPGLGLLRAGSASTLLVLFEKVFQPGALAPRRDRRAGAAQGLPPGGWIAEVGEVIGGAGPTPWRVWRTPARGVSPAGADMGGGAAVVVSGPDAGAGHTGGWLGPSQGWISPPSRRAVAGWEAWHGSDGAPARP